MSMSGVKDVKLTERPWRKSRLVGWLSAPLISCFFEVFFFFDTYDASPFFGTPSFATDNRVFSTHMTARTHTYIRLECPCLDVVFAESVKLGIGNAMRMEFVIV